VLGRTVAGTFSTAKGGGAVRAADIPPTKPTLDRRRDRLFASALAALRYSPKQALIPPPATDDCSRKRLSPCYKGASRHGSLLKEGQAVGEASPRPRNRTPWTSPIADSVTAHAWVGGSFRKSSGIGWIVTTDHDGKGDAIAQRSESLGTRQTAFDAEVAAIFRALTWFTRDGHGWKSPPLPPLSCPPSPRPPLFFDPCSLSASLLIWSTPPAPSSRIEHLRLFFSFLLSPSSRIPSRYNT